jgi:hypothetical protein
MKHTSHPNIRKELHECFHHCERLLASALMSDNPPFSQEELAMMKHYAEEIGKISLSHDTFPISENRQVRGLRESHTSPLSRGWGGWEHHESGWWNVGKR